MTTARSAGDPIPSGCRLIEVRVAELRQLFNAIDPSPFRERDLDPRAEAGPDDEAAVLREAIHEYFGQQVVRSRRRLRELFRRGRISLLIALAFLAASIAVGDAIASYLGGSRLAGVVREGFLIGGWVAMWRPLEVFLYDWWPIRAEERLLRRLSAIPVRIEYADTATPDAWRSDWPATSTLQQPRMR